jgi:hypothetical protein
MGLTVDLRASLGDNEGPAIKLAKVILLQAIKDNASGVTLTLLSKRIESPVLPDSSSHRGATPVADDNDDISLRWMLAIIQEAERQAAIEEALERKSLDLRSHRETDLVELVYHIPSKGRTEMPPPPASLFGDLVRVLLDFAEVPHSSKGHIEGRFQTNSSSNGIMYWNITSENTSYSVKLTRSYA